MQSKAQSHNSIFGIAWNSVLALMLVLLVLIVVVLFIVFTAQSAQAQTFKVIHTFTGGPDGASPVGALTMDQAGNFYGTASGGGSGNGTVYRLSKKGSNWIFNPLYAFAGGNDGGGPWAGVTIGPDGSLYGTTTDYGTPYGTVFNLKPPVTACKAALCPWTETVLYLFNREHPGGGNLIFDQAGNLYGTTVFGGVYGLGTVFELVPSQGGWTESVLYTFVGNDGAYPDSALIFDNVGNLYGTTLEGFSLGNVFQLTPSGSGWTENVLYNFHGTDGAHPYPGPMFDQSGNIYGATADLGPHNGGTVFKLTPSGGGWTFSLVYSLTDSPLCSDCGPVGNLIMDGAGNIYGTTSRSGDLACNAPYGCGTVFQLTPSGGSWTYTLLHDFTGSDGANPSGGLIFDENGNLYGVASAGGSQGVGTIWEITFP
jgi:uncharacterized repeat protein (TIGR03803 family)